MKDNVFGPSKTHNILYTDVYVLLNSLSLSLSLSLPLQLCCLPKDLASLSDAHWHHHHLCFNSQSVVIPQYLNMDEM